MTTLQKILGGFEDAFRWLQENLAYSEVSKAIYADLGVDPQEAGEIPAAPQERLDSITRYREAVDPTPEAFLEALDDIIAVLEVLANLKDKFGNTKEEVAHGVLGLLVTNYARLRFPALYWLAEPVFFLEGLATSDPVVKGNTVAFTNGLKKVGAFTLDLFFRDPSKSLRAAKDFFTDIEKYFPLETEADAQRLSDFTFFPLALALAIFESDLLKQNIEAPSLFDKREGALIGDSIYGWDASPVSTTPIADRIANRTLTFSLIGIKKDTSNNSEFAGTINGTMAWVPRAHGGPGLLFALGGSEQVEQNFSNGWKFSFKLGSVSAIDFLIGKNPSVNGPSDASASFTIEQPPDESGLPHAIPDRKGTRLEFERLAFSGEISGRGAGVKARAQNGALVLAADKDGDGFLKEVLPAGETRIAFDLGLGLSSERGFFIEGGSGLEAVIPIAKTLGPVTIHQLFLSLIATTEAKPAHLTTEISVALGVKLGPIEASVDRLGFQMRIAFPEKGKPDFALGFKSPNGIGLAIDAKIVSGGGYLFFDAQKEEYAGIVHLKFEGGMALKAIGLLNTRLPGGAKGFSLVVIITAEGFTALPLGFGFMLTGVGGILGIHRTVNEDVLREGLKNRTLDSIMFPKDPIRNAPQILGVLSRVFPPQKSRHFFGLMAQISWGTPKPLLVIQIGLILELPSPVRLFLLGQLKADLPDEKLSLVRLRMDVLGVIDFGREEAALDATLYDSKLLTYALTGDMSMRLNWGRAPVFVLAVGGVHPRFKLPEKFPKLGRMKIVLASSENLKLQCLSYWAITSNTVQFGARVELVAKAHGFSIEGFVGYDVLVQFDPFFFIADFEAKVALKRGNTNLFSVKVKGALEGPRPLSVRGKATFEIFWWDVSISFNKTLISGSKPPPPAAVEVTSQLLAALREPGNWSAELPASEQNVVTLREVREANTVLLHPLGALVVRQRVLPLNTQLDKFGNGRLREDERRFEINKARLGQKEIDPQPITDHFAAAQFLALSDDEALSRPSFEKMPAGARFGGEEILCGEGLDMELEYETITFDPKTNQSTSEKKQRYKLDAQNLTRQARAGAVSRSEKRRVGRAKYRTKGLNLKLEEPYYVLATTDEVKAIDGHQPQQEWTSTRAHEELQKIRGTDPMRAKGLQVIAKHER